MLFSTVGTFYSFQTVFYSLFCSSAEVSEDGRYLIAGVSKGCDPVNSLYFYDLKKANNQINGKLELTPLFVKNDAKYEVLLHLHLYHSTISFFAD